MMICLDIVGLPFPIQLEFWGLDTQDFIRTWELGLGLSKRRPFNEWSLISPGRNLDSV